MTLQFAAEITLNRELAGGNGLDDMIDLFRSQIFRADIEVNIRLLENLASSAQPDSIDIRERRFDAFIAGDFYS